MDRVEQIASRAGDLPPLPQVASKVVQLVADPDSSAGDLVRVISRDQALTVKVLKIANSALFGVSQAVTTLSRAITLLGFNTLRSLVIAASTQALFRSKPTSSFQDRILWEHSLAVALAGRLVARRSRYRGIEEAFVSGLVHDIGKAVMDRNIAEQYQRVVELVYNDGIPFLEAEQAVLGFDHTTVGALVVRKWKLGETYEEAVQCHHDPRAATVDPKLSAVVSLANALCVRVGIGPERRPELDFGSLPALEMLGVEVAEIEEMTQEVEKAFKEEKELFRL
ncbi:MAG: HDOD domain-containing protein [Candidatus Schekmanbacteria bacterium]|nr:HDOD domain-containing protein [Candidatus Schekmanbacteria bacterium]